MVWQKQKLRITVDCSIVKEIAMIHLYFCGGKEADFALLLQVRQRKAFCIKKDQKNRSKQVDNCPKQDAHKQGTLR